MTVRAPVGSDELRGDLVDQLIADGVLHQQVLMKQRTGQRDGGHGAVEIGGELRMRGRNASDENWAIAIEKPANLERSVQLIVKLTDRAMATSGDYRNYFEFRGKRFSHTIDSRTGRPVTHRGAAVTVIADSSAMADALATALLVLGPDKGFSYAENERIAAYFLLRNESGIEEKMTGPFAALQEI